MSTPALGTDIHLSQLIFSPSPIPLPAPGPFSPGATAAGLQTTIGGVLDLAKAMEAIEQKAAQLGGLAGSSVGLVSQYPAGYGQPYTGCDIYYSSSTGAHEVHGDIRAKYNALGGANGVLGIPVTDETGTPDGIGRFNHFTGGSIYWTPHTGPMMVRGAIRDKWASLGWERSSLGYPVADEHRMVTTSPMTDPQTYWSFFQNGAILASNDGCDVALVAELSAVDLRRVIRTQFDTRFHASPNNIGLQPEVDTLSVTDWDYGFWVSKSRAITFRLYGFHDNGLLPDTNFTMDVKLTFGLAHPDTFTEATSQTLIVGLLWIGVRATGLDPQKVADGVSDGVQSAFSTPNPDPNLSYIPAGWLPITEIPTGANAHGTNIDVIGILVTAAGSLQVLLNPVPPVAGGFRQEIAQQQIQAFVDAS